MNARQILNDPFLRQYVSRDSWNTYYTCIPVDKGETSYECVFGFLDTCFSLHHYDETKWIKMKVPFYVPKSYHESYLNGSMQDTIVRIIK